MKPPQGISEVEFRHVLKTLRALVMSEDVFEADESSVTGKGSGSETEAFAYLNGYCLEYQSRLAELDDEHTSLTRAQPLQRTSADASSWRFVRQIPSPGKNKFPDHNFFPVFVP